MDDASTNWREACRNQGVVPGQRCTVGQLGAAGTALGRPVVRPLRELYLLADGFYDELGQWDVVWPLDQLVLMNLNFAETEAGFIEHSVAFGNDGAGEPFVVRADGSGDRVARWSLIDGDVDVDEGGLDAFAQKWLRLRAWPSES